MDDIPADKMTFYQVISRQWQIPLFLGSLILFITVLITLAPRGEKPTFDDKFKALEALVDADAFGKFYGAAEELRLTCENETQLGRIHALAAQARVRELRLKRELTLEPYLRRSAPVNYETILNDYSEAIERDVLSLEGADGVAILKDIAMCYWGLDRVDMTTEALRRGLETAETFDPELHRMLINVLLSGRPRGYLEEALTLAEEVLQEPEADIELRSWAFVRKLELMIEQGRENEALELLNNADASFYASKYGQEMEFLRGRAIRRSGRIDEADILLRQLFDKITEPGDIYAQTALELGKISLEQYRDYDAQIYFEKVVSSQSGKDWYIAGKEGLAQVAVLQHRYAEARTLFKETAELLLKKPHNKVLTTEDFQRELEVQAHQLTLLKRYDLALHFLEIEQMVAAENDVDAAYLFATTHKQRGNQIREEIAQTPKPSADEEGQEWLQDKQQLAKHHYQAGADQFVRAAALVVNDDQRYADCLWQAAECYDLAGDIEKTIAYWQRYVGEREGQTPWPQALYRLGQAYQAVARFDEAIAAYTLLRNRHPKLPVAADAAVALARCYLSLDPTDRDQAETILHSIFSDRALSPQATPFREAMFVLGELYYNSGKYRQAIEVLTEAIARYPSHPKIGKVLFLVADSYRLAGKKLEAELTEMAGDVTASVSRKKLTTLRSRNVEHARDYFQKAIDEYEGQKEGGLSKLNELYLRLSWRYYGDCYFDLGLFQQAVEIYEDAILRYPQTVTALGAFVQLINCHLQLGNQNDAKVANQRAMWQLRRITDEALARGPRPLSRNQWMNWFTWTDTAGLW